MTSSEKFDQWFAKPLAAIETLPECNAAFLAFSVSFGLFERFVKSELKRKKKKASPKNFRAESVALLGIDSDLFNKFWGAYRDGIQHYLQPKVFQSGGIKYGWAIDASYGELPEYYEEAPNHRIIRISPWKWTKLVVDLWRGRPELFELLESHPLGTVAT